MNDEPTFWFPRKRYGFGWGLPVRWQGWVVCIVYTALLVGGVYYFKERSAVGLVVCVLALTALLIGVMALKGEKPLRWRWGKD